MLLRFLLEMDSSVRQLLVPSRMFTPLAVRAETEPCFSSIFGRAMYTKLTVGGGCSLLAGISIAFAPGIWILWRYGAQIRAKSKYATGTS